MRTEPRNDREAHSLLMRQLMERVERKLAKPMTVRQKALDKAARRALKRAR